MRSPPDLKENLVMEARAIEIQWSSLESGMTGPKAVHRGRPGVYVRTINEPIVKRGKTRSGRVRMEREFTADYMVVTTHFRHCASSPLRQILVFQKGAPSSSCIMIPPRRFYWNSASDSGSGMRRNGQGTCPMNTEGTMHTVADPSRILQIDLSITRAMRFREAAAV